MKANGTAELEASLQSTLHSLSLILSFHSSVQQLNVAPYAPHAPLQLTHQIKQDSANFNANCDQIQQRLLRAIAVIQRDARRASGQPPLLPPSPEAPAPPPSDIASTSTLPGQVPIPDSTENDMDEDNVNDSLFGDSVVASPVAGAVAEGVDGPGNALEGMTFELAQVMAPGEQTALPGSAPPPVSDLSSLLAMVDDSSGAPSALPLPLPFPLPATDFALPPPPIGMGMDFQLPPPPLGTDFNQFNPYAAFDPTLGSTGTTGLAGGGAVDLSNFDYGSMGDIGQMPSEADLEELMKSLGGANGAGTT